MALGVTQPQTEISWGGKGGQRVGPTTLPPSCADSLKTQGCLSLLHDDNVQNIRQVYYNLPLSESLRVEDFRLPLLCS